MKQNLEWAYGRQRKSICVSESSHKIYPEAKWSWLSLTLTVQYVFTRLFSSALNGISTEYLFLFGIFCKTKRNRRKKIIRWRREKKHLNLFFISQAFVFRQSASRERQDSFFANLFMCVFSSSTSDSESINLFDICAWNGNFEQLLKGEKALDQKHIYTWLNCK